MAYLSHVRSIQAVEAVDTCRILLQARGHALPVDHRKETVRGGAQARRLEHGQTLHEQMEHTREKVSDGRGRRELRGDCAPASTL